MSSEAEELLIEEERLLTEMTEIYSKNIADLIEESKTLRTDFLGFKNRLQVQFIKEFDHGSSSHNRGLLYAQCGTNCQSIIHLLNAIESDLSLIDDLPLRPKEEVKEIQIF
jgi:hypothetical protein